ncbi:hypothetical protein CNX65_28330 [Actinosynnema pretiosum]|uniref:Uncharacterized protein n=1 Tax=Actinosynnema pretiosum TaxID=42197 RepID=A0A290ZCE3_9PSEU|nr:hypothetical protein CNX65_28330 [Actinosynnema pretiosum]
MVIVGLHLGSGRPRWVVSSWARFTARGGRSTTARAWRVAAVALGRSARRSAVETPVLVTTSVKTALRARGLSSTRAASVAALGSGAVGKPSTSSGGGGCLVAITLTRSVGGLPLRERTRI